MNYGKATLAVLAVLSASVALADDFKTISGKEYKNAKVSRVEPDGVVISFSGGIVKIPFNELSPEIQKKYSYDPQAAGAYSDEQKQQQAALYQQRKADEQRTFEERKKYWSEHPMPSQSAAQSQSVTGSLHSGALDRDAGPKPEQLQDGTVVSLDRQIRTSLKDPDSVIYTYWSELEVGQSPGGNPAWTVTVTYRAKNSFGAYVGNNTCSYWFKDGTWMLKP